MIKFLFYLYSETLLVYNVNIVSNLYVNILNEFEIWNIEFETISHVQIWDNEFETTIIFWL